MPFASLSCLVRYNCTIGLPAYYSRRLDQESKDFCNNVLKPLLQTDEFADAVWKVCSRIAWLEQNTRDWDGAQAAHITGAAQGYQESMAADASIVAENVSRMGFNFYG
ncbi:unnamed protein product [Cladocopium goreaui]|uniref:Uncharacterized protein n=1 Tax=Cladocopium goreaui TaxID=2562237 RepID=A0A9P1D5V7_9DINO|nr:unnamed protein product [Cladocopium goreaui]